MPDVAFCRPLIKGMRGNDVVAHKRAISRWRPNLYGWHAFTPYYGVYFETAVKVFQRDRGILATGKIGKATHEALERAKNRKGEPVFDAYATRLAADFCKQFAKTPEQRIRESIVNAAFFWYANKWQIAYSQYRPFALAKPPGIPMRWDCSGFVTSCYYAGGAKDPNGRGYDGLGYTGTLKERGQRISVGDLKLADLIFYGFSSGRPGFNAGDPTHVALYAGIHDGARMVLSLGSYPMGFYRYNYRSINHMRTFAVT